MLSNFCIKIFLTIAYISANPCCHQVWWLGEINTSLQMLKNCIFFNCTCFRMEMLIHILLKIKLNVRLNKENWVLMIVPS